MGDSLARVEAHEGHIELRTVTEKGRVRAPMKLTVGDALLLASELTDAARRIVRHWEREGNV